jgi:hypothetical protein
VAKGEKKKKLEHFLYSGDSALLSFVKKAFKIERHTSPPVCLTGMDLFSRVAHTELGCIKFLLLKLDDSHV